MEPTKTRTQLVEEAAGRLSVVGTGQSLESDYAVLIDNNIDPLFLQLAADGICNVTNDLLIPAEWFDSLVGLLANQSAAVGGKNFDPQIKQFYENMLKRVVSMGPSYSVLESEYF